MHKLNGFKWGIAIALSSLILLPQVLPAQTPPASPPSKIKPDVPYVPTPESVVMEMLTLAKVTQEDVVYDLGSGDGRLVITAAQKFGAKRGVGIEINPGLVNRSNENAKEAGVANRVQFVQQDLFQTDFSQASVVTLYLLSKLNLQLRPKLLTELKPGTRLVSHAFSMGDWQPDRTVLVPDNGRPRTLYFWVIPATVAGTWRGSLATQSGQQQAYSVKIDQRYQKASGRVEIGGQTISIPQMKLVGDQLSFKHQQTLNGKEIHVSFNGRVMGNTLQGEAELTTKTATEIYRLTAKRQ